MRTPLMSDQDLLKQYLAGNEMAFERLVARHKDKVYTSIYMMVKDSYLAEDIFQETYIKVIDTLRSGKYNDEGKFLPWVMRIAYNLCIDYFRRVKRGRSWLDVLKACPVPMDDLPPRRREYFKKKKL